MDVVSLLNPKGGVGKTTTAVNLAAALAERGRRVVLVDLDDQLYATRWAGVDETDNLVDALLGESPMVPQSSTLGIDMVPGSRALSAIDSKLDGSPALRVKKYNVLAGALKPLAASYDVVVLDCPGDLDTIAINAILASTHVVLTMSTSFLALSSLGDTWEQVERLAEASKVDLRMKVLMGMYQRSKRIQQDVVDEVLKEFGPEEQFQTIIPFNVRLEECPSHQRSILQHDNGGIGAQAFRDLTNEVLTWLD